MMTLLEGLGLVLVFAGALRMFLSLSERYEMWRVLFDPHVVLHYIAHEWRQAAGPVALNLLGIALLALGAWLGGGPL
jgi:hypothetical protein